MSRFRSFVARLLKTAFGWQRRRDENDAALDDEVRGHFALAVADRIARGESPEHALAAARREFGNISHVKEVTREAWGGLWLERLLQDLRYAVRSLRRAPGFALVSVLTLALGIGVDTAMFTLVNGVLLRPLPFADPDRLFVASYTPPRGPFNSFPGLYDIHYVTLLKNDPVFARVATYSTDAATLSGSGDPVMLPAGKVTTDFFGVLGVRPALGRTFAAGDAPAVGEGSVAVLSDRLWRSRFGADSSVIGKTLVLDGQSRTIVGVMPSTFGFPAQAELWLPTAITTSPHQIRLRVVIGRLEPGLTADGARAAFAAISSHFTLAPGTARAEFSPELVPLKDYVVGDARRPLLVFAGAVVFVLLIACANVANLLLMRIASRDREMAVRAALGAGRARLVRQVLTETFAISLVGAVAGIALAGVGVRAVLALAPGDAIPRAENVHLDPKVLLFTIGLSIVTTVICGLVPALHATEDRLRASLADGGARAGTASHGRLRSLLVVAEIALALVLFTGAGLMLRSFHRMRSVDLGFHSSKLFATTIDLPARSYTTVDGMHAFDANVLDGLRRIPGVDAAAAVNWLPLGGNLIAGDFHIEGGPALPPDYMVDKMVVSPDYFRAIGMRIERGRAFTAADRAAAAKVVIISRSIADRFWPNGDAIGRRVTQADHPTPNDWMTIVGVVNDVVQQGPTSKPDAALYQPIEQTSQPFFMSHMTFVVHETSGASVAAAMRRVMRAADPTLPLGSISALGEIIDSTMLTPRFQSRMLLAFAVLALTLAMIGIYGVLAYGVTQRFHEIGVRIALGASRFDVVRMLLRRAVGLTVPGLLLGLAAAFALTRVLANFLFQITPTDPATFVAVSALLAAVAVIATIAPARRAVRVDPLVALRQE